MDENAKRKIINGLINFPIGVVTHGNINANDIIQSKASIVLYLSDVFGLGTDKSEMVETVLKEALNVESLPNIASAEKMFKLSNGFLQDYNKIELIKEKNKSFDDMYVTLVQVLSNYSFESKKSK